MYLYLYIQLFRAVNTELNQSFYSILLDDLSCATALLESAWKNKGQVGTYRTFKAFPIKPRLRLLAGCSCFLALVLVRLSKSSGKEAPPYFNVGVRGGLTVGFYSCGPASCMPLILCL